MEALRSEGTGKGTEARWELRRRKSGEIGVRLKVGSGPPPTEQGATILCPTQSSSFPRVTLAAFGPEPVGIGPRAFRLLTEFAVLIEFSVGVRN